jgi:GTP pyrophosphokinase
VEEAYRVAEEAHRGQYRASGAPYIEHPVATAVILARMQLDPETIAAALLHDVPEDTAVGLDAIRARFGERIARLVDGVTKLSKIKWSGEEGALLERDQQAENLRKMFLAMAEDLRVVLIKLADRLHNMRTINALPREKAVRIAQQTMEIYAPLANRLGIWQIKSELEDLAFKTLEPDKYQELARQIELHHEDRERYLKRVISVLRRALDREGIEAEISGRNKHIYSIYRKMLRKGRPVDQIYDVLAVRVLVNTVMDCYAALGVIHSLWKPVPGEFDDYIAVPKESMYQSLHTAVLSLEGKPLEVQIRTHEMHEVAEYGIAAHWRYKEGGRRDLDFETKIAWLRRLMEWRDEMADAEVFVESLKSDVFQDQVYVFTPRGDVIDLPAGATPIDFAYRIHTDVGHQCVGAKVNDRLVPLDYTLRTGDVVKIITSKVRRGPSRDWLNPNLGYVKTATAREKIRQWFRRQEREENIAQGKTILDAELRKLGLEGMPYQEVMTYFPQYSKLDDFLAAIGFGAVTTQQLAQKLVRVEEETVAPGQAPRRPSETSGLKVMGVGDLLTRLAPCCRPMPGDEIVGYITRGRGVTVHRADCENVRREVEVERLVKLDWEGVGPQKYPVTIRIHALDRVGLVRDVSTVIADEKINMTSVMTTTDPRERTATITVTVEVADSRELSKILSRLESVKNVLEVRRAVPSAVGP